MSFGRCFKNFVLFLCVSTNLIFEIADKSDELTQSRIIIETFFSALDNLNTVIEIFFRLNSVLVGRFINFALSFKEIQLNGI